ncbi:hypothetical protein V495_04292 [Pseudogymnoascus sp. VKM F-4514 (FW-929)]|nr:hypothetical protein V490_07924 [Pseudogymnoascus sp. VKM F-3557]KFY42878.1 hypothetical protein V495_04292 [Pseudogymnoascus sp. VKM F-4514 (FW-929)]KFY59749.1 hypothetical protein V497_04111 [Pseudogymnoascus sp. VKM F-4516 (FW-969)]
MSRYAAYDDPSAEPLNHPGASSSPPNPMNPPHGSFTRQQRRPVAGANTQPSQAYPQQRAPGFPAGPPAVPLHAGQQQQQQYFNREPYNTTSMASSTTPGADNFGQQAGGGIAGIAMGVADNRPRESGMEAMRSIPEYGVDGRPLNYNQSPRQGQGYRQPTLPPVAGQQRYRDADPVVNPAANPAHMGYYGGDNYSDEGYNNRRYDSRERSPYEGEMYGRQGQGQGNSRQDYPAAAGVPLMSVSRPGDSAPRAGDFAGHDPQQDAALHRYSQRIDPSWQLQDPNAIVDDGDDGLDYVQPSHHRNSLLSLGRSSDRLSTSTGGALAAGGALGAGALGGMAARNGSGSAAEGASLFSGPGNPSTGTGAHAAFLANEREKDNWMAKENKKHKKSMWIAIAVIAFLVIGGTVGGVLGAMLAKKGGGSDSSDASKAGGSGGSASDDTKANGDLSKDSAEIKALLNNDKLHKVFPGVDYTPMYTQYPDCLHYPASQNNVTRDLAVISQLTNVVRLYGTDCNQTQLVIHSIKQLGLEDKMKIWLGVWQDKNTTTNARQLDQMYDILKNYGTKPFLGAIIGNEMLFRNDITSWALGELLDTVRAKFKTLKYDLSVSTSDLGNSWDSALAAKSDYILSNVHPFFTGKPIAEAAEFTWQFWQNQDWPLKPDLKKNIIAETGWPTKGGIDCGNDNIHTCASGSVAGVKELNRFMDEWVCQALTNGTQYFWFEAFDEPWKISFNTPADPAKGWPAREWEDQWGIMDVNRVLKDGVVIPDCGGKTVD